MNKTNTEKKEASIMNEISKTNLQTIVIVGTCRGDYHNADVSKEFAGKLLAMVRPNGSIVVHSLSEGVRPICYIGEGAEISLARDIVDAEIELLATTVDGQQLSLRFEEVHSLCGVPEKHGVDSLAMTIIKCVSELDGKYGRIRIARLLRGSSSRCVLTMGVHELRAYGVVRNVSQKEVLILIDWLIEEGYLSYGDDEKYPTLSITEKGVNTLSEVENGGDMPFEFAVQSPDGENIADRVQLLKDWRKTRSEEIGKPLYLVLQNRTIKELAMKNPETIEDLQNIYGIGESKANTYGDEILEILQTDGL